MRLLALALIGCGASTPRQPGQPPIDNHAAAPVVIPSTTIDEVTLSRTPCMGMCPVYSVTIHRDGAVDWNGDSNVTIVGQAHARIDHRTLDQLAVALDAVRFFERTEDGAFPPPPCGSGATCDRRIVICTDTSSTRMVVKRGATTHTVEDSHCDRDPDLERIETLIDELANDASWVGR